MAQRVGPPPQTCLEMLGVRVQSEPLGLVVLQTLWSGVAVSVG